MRWRLPLSLVAVFASAAIARADDACVAPTPCPVETGAYIVVPPPGWDGKTPLAMIMFFHGAFNTARDTFDNTGLPAAAAQVGALLVLADGANRNWQFPGKTSPGGRDDFHYVNDVLDDVEKRFPIDKANILASGFSVGGSMVWNLACYEAKRFRAFAPVAGAFWEPLPQDCPSGPVSLRHIHGVADKTVPMKGRSLRNGQYKQGNVEESLRLLRVRDGCDGEPDVVEQKDDLACRTWLPKSCASKREVMVCLHPNDHMLEARWVIDGFEWMKSLPATDASPPPNATAVRAGSAAATK
jgi:polyhydroxybutyrate depolymerase